MKQSNMFAFEARLREEINLFGIDSWCGLSDLDLARYIVDSLAVLRKALGRNALMTNTSETSFAPKDVDDYLFAHRRPQRG